MVLFGFGFVTLDLKVAKFSSNLLRSPLVGRSGDFMLAGFVCLVVTLMTLAGLDCKALDAGRVLDTFFWLFCCVFLLGPSCFSANLPVLTVSVLPRGRFRFVENVPGRSSQHYMRTHFHKRQKTQAYI